MLESCKMLPSQLAKESKPRFSVKHLLDLPPELLQHIFSLMDVATFVLAIRACKRLWKLAKDSRRVLLLHLNQIPGRTIEMTTRTDKLFLLLRRRAAANLAGVDIMADRDCYAFDYSVLSSIDVRKSAISSQWSPSFALVCRSCPLVHLFNTDEKTLIPKGMLDATAPEQGLPYDFEVIRVVHSDAGDIAILHRPKPTTPEKFSEPDCSLYNLTYFCPPKRGSKQTRPASHGSITSPDPVLDKEARYRVAAMAVARMGLLAISWEHEDEAYRSEVWLYFALDESEHSKCKADKPDSSEVALMYDTGIQYNVTWISPRATTARPCLLATTPITKLTFNDSSLQILYGLTRGTPVHEGYRNIPHFSHITDRERFWLNREIVDCTGPPFWSRALAIGVPFYSQHIGSGSLHPTLEDPCQITYWALGISEERGEGAYVLNTTYFDQNCICESPRGLQKGRRSHDWDPIAQLVGYRRSVTSLGGIVSYSPRGRRIAIADWRDIYIWTLPEESLDMHCCLGHREDPLAELYPTRMEMNAVIHQLMFEKDSGDKMWALTDKGLLHVNLGPSAVRRRERRILQVGDMEREVEGAPGYWV